MKYETGHGCPPGPERRKVLAFLAERSGTTREIAQATGVPWLKVSKICTRIRAADDPLAARIVNIHPPRPKKPKKPPRVTMAAGAALLDAAWRGL